MKKNIEIQKVSSGELFVGYLICSNTQHSQLIQHENISIEALETALIEITFALEALTNYQIYNAMPYLAKLWLTTIPAIVLNVDLYKSCVRPVAELNWWKYRVPYLIKQQILNDGIMSQLMIVRDESMCLQESIELTVYDKTKSRLDCVQYEVKVADATIGEELEYWYIGKEFCCEDEVESQLNSIETGLKSYFKNIGLEFDLELNLCNSGQRLFHIGDWQFLFFDDVNVVEFHTKPYNLNQEFSVKLNDRKVRKTTGELFDLTIKAFMDKTKRVSKSGHKHIDIFRLLKGNAELLLRVIVDFENAAWLSLVIGRQAQQQEYYLYASDRLSTKNALIMVTSWINSCVSRGLKVKFDNFCNITNFVKLLKYLGLYERKCTQINLRHINDHEHCADINESPNTTLEFRVFDSPRNGAEMDAINKLILGRVSLSSKRQAIGELLDYRAYKVEDYNQEQAALQAAIFCKEAGLDYKEFELIMRIPITDEASRTFK